METMENQELEEPFPDLMSSHRSASSSSSGEQSFIHNHQKMLEFHKTDARPSITLIPASDMHSIQ